MTNPQSIRPVPMRGDWNSLRPFLQDIHKALSVLQSSIMPPAPVTNLVATAKAGGVIVQFTRSDGDQFILYANTTPNLNGAVRVDLALQAEYVDEVGAAAVKKYYWVKAKRGQIESTIAGPVSATTLALGTPITPPVAPAATQTPARSDETGNVEVGRPTGTSYERI